MDDTALRCPSCRAYDWYRDGFVMHEDDTGVIARRRSTPSAAIDTPWSCAQCGYEVPEVSRLRRRLTEAQSQHFE